MDLEYLDSLTPFIRQLHVDLIAKHVREENERITKQNNRR
jgi:hypothetical protein